MTVEEIRAERSRRNRALLERLALVLALIEESLERARRS